MEIAFSLLGVALTTLGLVFAYIWHSNGQIQRAMIAALERIEEGERGIAQLVHQNHEVLHQTQELLQQNQQTLQQNQEISRQLLIEGRQGLEALRVAMEGIQELLHRPSPVS